jgi:uncharacterized protein YxeA
MKKTIITMLIALVAMVASAETYNYLKFTKTDNSTVTYSVEGLKLTYDNTNVTITNVDGTATLALAQVKDMEFTNDASSTSGALLGDVNGDGTVNVADITDLINAVLNEDYSSIVFANADMDSNGSINVTDVTELINQVLNNN